MLRVRCPECGIEAEVTPQYGEEVVSVYCLKHSGGAECHIRPVYMTPIPAVQGVVEPEPVAA
jgi:hypothetical protein